MTIQKSTLGVLLGIMILLTGCVSGQAYIKNARLICLGIPEAEKENCIKAVSDEIANRINWKCNITGSLGCEQRVIRKAKAYSGEIIGKAMGEKGAQRIKEESRKRDEAARKELAKERRIAQQKQKKQKAKEKALEKILRKEHASEQKPTDSEVMQYGRQFLRAYGRLIPYPLKNASIKRPFSTGITWLICLNAFQFSQKTGNYDPSLHLFQVKNKKIVGIENFAETYVTLIMLLKDGVADSACAQKTIGQL